MQSSAPPLAALQSRCLTVSDGVSACVSVIVQDIRCCGYRPPTLEGVAMIISAFMPFRFFAPTPIFSVSLSSFSLSPV
jgi:hypothetical protein